jgi:ubiquinone/menaquinone biosynthesis C-methylase UbiE
MANANTPVADSSWWTSVIEAVKTPLGFFVLVILLVEAILTIIVATASKDAVDAAQKTLLIQGALGLLFLMVILVAVMSFVPGWLQGARFERPAREVTPERPDRAARPSDSEVDQIIDKEGKEVIFANEKPRVKLHLWYDQMRPLLHQAANYSVPTYYLDDKLNVVDWNIAFEVVFGEILKYIRGKHVVEFIARMANHDEMFAHAREFTRDVTEKNVFPFVDLEPIEYQSPEFGLVKTVKIAAQLTDAEGIARGWAVALWPREIDWKAFQPKLHERINSDKMWSVYSASYDRVLLEFPPYRTLIEDVIAVVPKGNLSVVDLGSGTGNVTRALVDRGHRVTAVESNLGMLDRMDEKQFDTKSVKVIKCAMEHLECLPGESYDAAVMVNVLYAVNEPLKCLRDVQRMLRKGGLLGLSTTHSETRLDPLLDRIEGELRAQHKLEALAEDWNTIYKVNKGLETTIVRRHTREEIKGMVETAGFEIIKETPATYCDTVMLLHARKKD